MEASLKVSEVIEILRNDPNSRQAVIQIWNSEDLNKSTKDKACNMSCVFRIREGHLELTVYNRSNDMVWGAYGANAVQFSMLQEYVAAHLNLPLGAYTQITNSYHVYTTGAAGELWEKLNKEYVPNQLIYNQFTQLVYMLNHDMEDFEHDLKLFFNTYDEFGLREITELKVWKSLYFKQLVLPMLSVYLVHKKHGAEKALTYAHHITDDAWLTACKDWLQKRVK
jgi:hypothetical protein